MAAGSGALVAMRGARGIGLGGRFLTTTDGAGYRAGGTLVLLEGSALLLLEPPKVLNFGSLIPVALVLATLAFLATRRTGSTRLPLSVLLMIVWLCVSGVWAAGHLDTTRQMSSLILVVAAAVAIGSRLTLAQITRSVAVGGLVVLLISVLVAIVNPSYGLMPPGYEGGSLRGIFIHRNSLGAVLSLALAAILCVPVGARRFAVAKIVAYCSVAGGIFATQSSTALVSSGVMTVAYFLVRGAQRLPQKLRVPAAVASVALVAFVVKSFSDSPLALAALDRSDSLTGRTQIWAAVQTLIAQRPWAGYGWTGVWADGSYLNREVSAAVGFYVPEAHNGYLDTLVQVGVVGLAAVALVYLTVFVRGLGALSGSSGSAALWPVIFVVRASLYNISESRIETPLEMFLVCSTLACLVAARGRTSEPSAADARDPHPRGVAARPMSI